MTSVEGSDVLVETTSGRLRGLRRNGVDRFLGVPYATAARFGPPRPVRAVERDAVEHGPECPQLTGMLERHLGLFRGGLWQDEDCTTLDVYAPSGRSGARRPVVVWIHGGAFTTGGTSNPWYDGSRLAGRRDVVVVVIGYRLGVFGFLGASNLGLRDQVAAIEWVRANADPLGADPDRITLFGESAGGASALALATVRDAPAVAGVFAMSPSLRQLRTVEEAQRSEQEVLALAGVTQSDQLLSWSTADLLELQHSALSRPGAGASTFTPVRDGDLLPVDWDAAAATTPVPVALGTTRDEMLLFAAPGPGSDPDAVRTAFGDEFGEGADHARAVYSRARPGAEDSRVLLSRLATDRELAVPARRLAEARANHGLPVWLWWFTWPSTALDGALGSCHSLDVPFVFDNLDAPDVEVLTGPEPPAALAVDYSGALISLARTGSAGWSTYDLARRRCRVFDTGPAMVDDPEHELRALWSAATPARTT